MLERVAPTGELGEFLAELLGRDRRVPDLAALAVDSEAPAAEVEVAVTRRGEFALSEAHEEEQHVPHTSPARPPKRASAIGSPKPAHVG